MNPKPETLEKVQTIIREKKEGKGTIGELCAKHGIPPSYFYQVRSKVVGSNKPKRKYTKQAKFVDIPLAPNNHSYKIRVFEIECSSVDEIQNLMGKLK